MIKNVVKVNHERSAEELKLLLEKKDLALAELRARLTFFEQLLKTNSIPIPDYMNNAAPSTTPANTPQRASVAELMDQLQDTRTDLKGKSDRISELNRERDEAQRMLQASEEEKQRLQSRIMDLSNDREQIEYERGEKADEVERLQHDKVTLQQQIDELSRINYNLTRAAAADGGRESSGVAATESEKSSQASVRADQTEEERLRDQERPLKRKVSQLDKNLEQLTVMYHKLVAQNSSLRVEITENDKKIQRKDQRIGQLERNLREAKQKYEKLLTQCANLTAAMDVMGRSKPSGSFSGTSGTHGMRHPNIKRPMRGGVHTRFETAENAPQASAREQAVPVDQLEQFNRLRETRQDSPTAAKTTSSRTRLHDAAAGRV